MAKHTNVQQANKRLEALYTKPPQTTPNIIKITYFQNAVLFNQKAPREAEGYQPK